MVRAWLGGEGRRGRASRRVDPGRVAPARPPRGAGGGGGAGGSILRADVLTRTGLRAALRLRADRGRSQPHGAPRPDRGVPASQPGPAQLDRALVGPLPLGRRRPAGRRAHRRCQGGREGRRLGDRPGQPGRSPAPATPAASSSTSATRGAGPGRRPARRQRRGRRVPSRRPRGPAAGRRPPPRSRRVRVVASHRVHPARRRRRCRALDHPSGQGQGVAAGRRLRRDRRDHAASALARPGGARGRAPGVPRRHHPGASARWRCWPTRLARRRSSRSSTATPPGELEAEPMADDVRHGRGNGRTGRARGCAVDPGRPVEAALRDWRAPGARPTGCRRSSSSTIATGGHRRAPAHGSGGVSRMPYREAGGLRRRAASVGPWRRGRVEPIRPERQLMEQGT